MGLEVEKVNEAPRMGGLKEALTPSLRPYLSPDPEGKRAFFTFVPQVPHIVLHPTGKSSCFS